MSLSSKYVTIREGGGVRRKSFNNLVECESHNCYTSLFTEREGESEREREREERETMLYV